MATITAVATAAIRPTLLFRQNEILPQAFAQPFVEDREKVLWLALAAVSRATLKPPSRSRSTPV
jgi:hypothetical protein